MEFKYEKVTSYKDMLTIHKERVNEISEYLIENFWEYKLLNDIFPCGNGDTDISECSLVGLYQALETIPDRIREAIIYRYREGLSYREVGNKIGVSRERSRQIVAKGLRILHSFNVAVLFVKTPGEEIQKSRYNILAMGEQISTLSAELKKDTDYTSEVGLKAINLEELELSVRAYNCLKRYGLHTVGDVLALDAEDFRKVRNLGRKCYLEVSDKFKDLGFDLPNPKMI